MSARTRLALACSLLILLVGILMLVVVSVAMRFVPTYDFTAAGPSTGAATALEAVGTIPTLAATPGFATATGIVISDEGDVLNTLLVVSALALLVIGAFGAYLSWLIAGRMLRPLAALTRAAERASGGSLSHRVALTGPDDEFTRLSSTFDDMLDRLERSFTAHERFAANASHELRTPLVTAKALLDVGRDEPDPARLSLLIERLSETNDRSLLIVDAMLDLSDTGRTVIATSSVDIPAVVEDELALLSAEAASAGVDVVVNSGMTAVTLGDPVLIARLVGNLLTNAVRHNDERGIATVTIECASDDPLPVVLTVENSGEPITREQLALLSEPFYRARGRIRAEPRPHGPVRETHGLGLALVAGIVDVHGGTLAFSARPAGGLIVTVRLPGGDVS